MNLKKFFGLALSCALLGAALTACGQQEQPVTSSGEPAIYTVEFKNGGRVLQTSEVRDGEFATYEGATPLKNKTPEFSFTFSGWDKDPATTPIHADTTFLAQFTSSKNSYVAKFMNGSEVFDTQTIEYGGYATIPNGIPTKDADAQYTYTFDKWEPDVQTTIITEDTVFTAKYANAVNSYTVKFMNGEDEIASQIVEYGKKATAPNTIPTKAEDDEGSYVFAGWNPKVDSTTIVGDTVFTATFTKYAKAAVVVDDFEAYNADNLPNYELKKYSEGWVDTAAYLKYEEGEISPLGGAKSGRFHIWNNGVAFRASKNISLTGTYHVNNFHAELKAILGAKVTFRLETPDGSYFDYRIAQVPSDGWLSLDLPLADFKANSTEATLGQIAASKGLAYERVATGMMAKFQVIYTYNDNIGSEKDIYIDNVEFNYLKNLGLNIYPTEIEAQTFVLHKEGYDVKLSFATEGVVNAKVATQDIAGTYRAGYLAAQNMCGVIVTINEANVSLKHTNNTLAVVAIDEALASFAALGDKFMRVTVMNNFEQYTETGVGYDQAHAASARSGMRGDIYADYYSGSSGSTIGGSGWSMMGSTDYAALATEGEGAQANQYAELKSSGVTMRFMSWAAYSDTHNKDYRGSVLSVMIKGGATADRTCRIKVYYSKTVTTSTQQSNCAAAEFTIAAGSDWTEYTIALDTSKVYYSISITFLVPSGGNKETQRIGVDDIVFHY